MDLVLKCLSLNFHFMPTLMGTHHSSSSVRSSSASDAIARLSYILFTWLLKVSSVTISSPQHLEVLGIGQGPLGPCNWNIVPRWYLRGSIKLRTILCSFPTG